MKTDRVRFILKQISKRRFQNISICMEYIYRNISVNLIFREVSVDCEGQQIMKAVLQPYRRKML
jgi:hypothetical protein